MLRLSSPRQELLSAPVNPRLFIEMEGSWKLPGAGRVARMSAGIRRSILRARIHDRDFGVISNNCWGAHIYQRLGEPYRTPFVGMFLAPECYLRLLLRLRWYLRQPLQFRDRSRHESMNGLRAERHIAYPIGCLADEVELHFIHYGSKDEAAAKWSRRVARLTPHDDHLFVKFCDRGGYSPMQLSTFDQLPFRHKVCFVAKPMPQLQSAVWIPESKDGSVPDGRRLSYISPKYFDTAGWINGSDGRSRWWRLFRCA